MYALNLLAAYTAALQAQYGAGYTCRWAGAARKLAARGQYSKALAVAAYGWWYCGNT
jgi:hypothetical protein